MTSAVKELATSTDFDFWMGRWNVHNRRLAQRLARSPRAKAGDGFLPHLTVCRFTASARPQPLDHPVSLEPFPIAVISLMQSILRSEGAIHSVVSSISLA